MALREISDPPLPMRLIALLALTHVGFGGSRLVLTLQSVNLQASPFAVGLLMSLLMVVPMFVAVAIGRWADRAGFFRPTILGFALLAAGGVRPKSEVTEDEENIDGQISNRNINYPLCRAAI